jgi:hypothetical protein
VHASARRRSKLGADPWARGPNSACRGWCCCLFLRKSRVGSKRRKDARNVVFFRFSGRLARIRAGVYLDLSGCPGRLGPGERGDRDLEVERSRLPVLQFIIAAFSVHLMRNNNKDLNSNKRFNNFTNRLT